MMSFFKFVDKIKKTLGISFHGKTAWQKSLKKLTKIFVLHIVPKKLGTAILIELEELLFKNWLKQLRILDDTSDRLKS